MLQYNIFQDEGNGHDLKTVSSVFIGEGWLWIRPEAPAKPTGIPRKQRGRKGRVPGQNWGPSD